MVAVGVAAVVAVAAAVGATVGGVATPSVATGVGVGEAGGIWIIPDTGEVWSPQADTDLTVITYVLPGLGLFTVYAGVSCVPLNSTLDLAPKRVTVTA